MWFKTRLDSGLLGDAAQVDFLRSCDQFAGRGAKGCKRDVAARWSRHIGIALV